MARTLAGDVVEGVPEELELAVSPTMATSAPADERRRLRVQREQTVRRTGSDFPFASSGANRLDRDGVADEPDRVRAPSEDLPGLGGLLSGAATLTASPVARRFLGARSRPRPC
jgi:hypothetical protein